MCFLSIKWPFPYLYFLDKYSAWSDITATVFVCIGINNRHCYACVLGNNCCVCVCLCVCMPLCVYAGVCVFFPSFQIFGNFPPLAMLWLIWARCSCHVLCSPQGPTGANEQSGQDKFFSFEITRKKVSGFTSCLGRAVKLNYFFSSELWFFLEENTAIQLFYSWVNLIFFLYRRKCTYNIHDKELSLSWINQCDLFYL